MLIRMLAIMISVTLWCLALGHQPPRVQAQGGTSAGERARSEVRKLGVGPKARVEVRLLDGNVLKGSVSAAGEDTFTVTDSKTGATRTVAYADVARVKRPGGGLSTRTWVIIGAAAAAAVIVGVTVIRPVLCDGGAGC